MWRGPTRVPRNEPLQSSTNSSGAAELTRSAASAKAGRPTSAAWSYGSVQRQEANGAHWLEATHDGWGKPFGAIHRRRLYLSESGEDIRGEDMIEAESPQPYTLRFHLHPSVQASLQQDGAAVLMRLRSGGGWILRADAIRLSLDESIYLGSGELRKTEQVVLTGREGGPQQVKWAIHKVG